MKKLNANNENRIFYSGSARRIKKRVFLLTKSHNNYFSIIRIQHSFTHNLTTRKSLSWLLIKLFFPLFLTSLPMCFIHWGTLNNADNKKLKSVCSELKWCLIALCCQLRFNSRSFIVTIQQRAQLVGGYVSGKLFGMYFLCLQQLPLSLSFSQMAPFRLIDELSVSLSHA